MKLTRPIRHSAAPMTAQDIQVALQVISFRRAARIARLSSITRLRGGTQ